jgi:hypothetical protein
MTPDIGAAWSSVGARGWQYALGTPIRHAGLPLNRAPARRLRWNDRSREDTPRARLGYSTAKRRTTQTSVERPGCCNPLENDAIRRRG